MIALEALEQRHKDSTPFPKGRRLPFPYARVYLRAGWTRKGVIKAIRKGRYTIDDGEMLYSLFGIATEADKQHWKF